MHDVKFWTHAGPVLARHIFSAMPWVTLIGGCASGTAVLALMAHFAGRMPLDQNTVRMTFLPVVGALAFVPRLHSRPLIQTTPVPSWVASAGQILLALPVVALTCAVQLALMASTVPAHAGRHLPAVRPLIAQFTGWSLLTLSVAACCERTRYAALSGAIAAPVTYIAIAAAWFTRPLDRYLLTPPEAAAVVTVAWYTIGVAAIAFATLAIRDQWHRYMRRLHLPT